MKSIPNILHMIWIGQNDIPDYFYENMSAWKNLMPDWQIRTWTNSDLNQDNIEFSYLNLINKSNIGAQKADLLRYYIVNKFGGYYVDCDITPKKSLDYLDIGSHDLILCHDLKIEWAYIINAFFGSCSNHKVLNYILEQMYNVNLSDPNIHLTTGPAALGNAYFTFKEDLNCLILPHWFFYRNKKGDIDLETNQILTEDKEGIFGSHQYASTWTK